ncbi:MAG: DUF177 domain-containing protein [Hyphomicrobium sp.]
MKTPKTPLTDDEPRRLAAEPSKVPPNPLRLWAHATTEIPAGGLSRERAASEAERADIAKALGIPAVERLVARYKITSIAGGGWRLEGTISAAVVQSCVVTLEPVPLTIEERFDVEFWRDKGEPAGGEDKSVLDGPDVEPLDGDDIGAGRIVFETVSGALDPYPRKPGAAFEWQDPAAVEVEKNNPFSVLGKLKDKP